MEALQRLMDGLSHPVFVLNEDGFYIYENPAAEALFGYDPAELTHKHLTDLVAADPDWVRSGFVRLKLVGHRRGRVLYRLNNGSPLKADVNSFMHTLANRTRVVVALVHPVSQHAPYQVRATEPEIQSGLEADQVRLLQLLAEGFSSLQIADLLHVEPPALARQMDDLLKQMNVSSRTEAAVRAIKTRTVV